MNNKIYTKYQFEIRVSLSGYQGSNIWIYHLYGPNKT